MKMTQEQLSSLRGQAVQDKSGKKLGTVGQVWADAAGQPNWISVKTGLFGKRESLVPLRSSRMEQNQLAVPFDKDMVKNAPHIEASEDEPLTGPEIDQLYTYYGMKNPPAAQERQPSAAERRSRGGQEEVTRSEERLRVGKETQPVGTARLRKYVVSEDVHTTIPVEHDEVRLEREPITADNRGNARPDIREDQREMSLQAERPVVGKEQVPVERVRMTEDRVTEDRDIDEPVRREMVDADMPERRRR